MKTIFAEIMVGKDFSFCGDLYHKTSYETATPITFPGEEAYFKWDTEVFSDD